MQIYFLSREREIRLVDCTMKGPTIAGGVVLSEEVTFRLRAEGC